jgi:hypothetical protein
VKNFKAQLFEPTENNICVKNKTRDGLDCFCKAENRCVLCYKLHNKFGAEIKRVTLSNKKESRNCDKVPFMKQFNFDNVPLGTSWIPHDYISVI